MFQRGQLYEFEISAYGFGGRGIAKIPTDDGQFIVFIDNAFPGQKVSARISVKRKQHAEAKIVEVIERSASEIINEFQEISGAPYIYVPWEIQELEKKKSTLSTFQKISGFKNLDDIFDVFISSPEKYDYRNKMEYSFSSIEHDRFTGEDVDDAFALGFKRRGTWWKVENLEKPSGLFDQDWESSIKSIREFLFKSGLKAWHPPKKEGFFRHIVVRKSFLENRFLVNLVVSSSGLHTFDAEAFADFLVELHPQRIAGIQLTVNDDVADRSKIENGSTRLLYGQPTIEENINGLTFQISMESFFQTNPKCASLLYDKAIDYLLENHDKKGEILDLFCGTGTIGQLIAKRAPDLTITGVDIVEEAITDAKVNAKKNGIQNMDFIASDVGKFLKEQPQFIGNISALILDPPRAGIAPKTLQKVIDLNAKTVVYISCNPSTQARDAQKIMEGGYELEKFSLVDQFPHTGHIESIAKFVKNEG